MFCLRCIFLKVLLYFSIEKKLEFLKPDDGLQMPNIDSPKCPKKIYTPWLGQLKHFLTKIFFGLAWTCSCRSPLSWQKWDILSYSGKLAEWISFLIVANWAWRPSDNQNRATFSNFRPQVAKKDPQSWVTYMYIVL